jgi:hypothetical protein
MSASFLGFLTIPGGATNPQLHHPRVVRVTGTESIKGALHTSATSAVRCVQYCNEIIVGCQRANIRVMSGLGPLLIEPSKTCQSETHSTNDERSIPSMV